MTADHLFHIRRRIKTVADAMSLLQDELTALRHAEALMTGQPATPVFTPISSHLAPSGTSLSSKWKERATDIKKMVEDGMTDEQIGDKYDVGRVMIGVVRSQLGIRRARGRRKASPRSFATPQEPMSPALNTYVDNGRTVTVLPPGHARGI